MGEAAKQILMVEPGQAETESLTRLFAEEGYRTLAARDGGAALALFRTQRPDLVLIKSDDEDGLACCRSIREEGDVPVVMLSCSCALDDKVRAFESGADDVLDWPSRGEREGGMFPPHFRGARELLLRVRAKLRRARRSAAVCLTHGAVSLDLDSHRVEVAGLAVELSLKERQLLEYFLRRPQRVIPRDQLLTAIWGSTEYYTKNVLDVYVSTLRSKIGDHDRSVIRTVRNVGYCLT